METQTSASVRKTTLKGIAWFLVAVIALIVAVTSCGDDAPSAAKNADDVFARWKAAGLEVSEHQPLKKHSLGKAECQRGSVGGVETTVCHYESKDAAAQAQALGLKMVGATTGAALPRDKILLVVADRAKADPEGKTINKLTKIFLGR